MECLARGGRRRHVIVSEEVTHMVLDQFPQTSSTVMKRKVHDGSHKFINGRYRTSPTLEIDAFLLLRRTHRQTAPGLLSSQLV
jgi:hypothetical protein